MVRGIVKNLEDCFDGMKSEVYSRIAKGPGLEPSWKTDSLNSTLRELPKIPITGLETGSYSGFGKHLYVNPEDLDYSKTVSLLV